MRWLLNIQRTGSDHQLYASPATRHFFLRAKARVAVRSPLPSISQADRKRCRPRGRISTARSDPHEPHIPCGRCTHAQPEEAGNSSTLSRGRYGCGAERTSCTRRGGLLAPRVRTIRRTWDRTPITCTSGGSVPRCCRGLSRKPCQRCYHHHAVGLGQ
jgi:hypothetical protein